jgi:hypothetical protein
MDKRHMDAILREEPRPGHSVMESKPEQAKANYAARLQELGQSLVQLSRRYRLFVQIEAVLMLVQSVAFYVLYTHSIIDQSMVAVVAYWIMGLLLLSLPGGALVRTGSAVGQRRRIYGYYEARLRRLDGTWKNSGDGGDEFAAAGHPHCMDLDLFGPGSLFEYLCCARTGGGRQWLADVLLSPASFREAIARQEAITELRNRHDLREYLADAAGPGKNNFKGDALKEWLDQTPVKFESVTHFLGACLRLFNVLAIALGLAGRVSPEVPLASLAAVGLFTVAVRGKTGPILEGASSHVVYELELLIAYARRFRRECFTCPLLKNAADSLNAISERRLGLLLLSLKLLRWHKDPAFTYLSYLSLWGALFAIAVEKQRAKVRKQVTKMATAISELEGLAGLAAYAFEHPDYPFPSFDSNETVSTPVFEAVALGHPLIDSEACVRNPVSLNPAKRFVLVSGSNMSGKSTYLRAIGLNFVLARAGAPVCAESLRLSMFSIATSMRVLDSLQDGKSRFLAEVTRVREIIDMAETGPLLFLLDELLTGTNSEDRQAGAAGVIGHLIEKGASGFLTTHDLALAELVFSRPAIAMNVHFVDHLDGAAMAFDYQLRDGIVPHSNGAAILAKLGIV